MSAWILAAQRLRDGRVVYLSASGWSEWLAEATVARTEEARRALEARAKDAMAAAQVVDAAPIEVEERAACPVPVRLRERIRALGPSVHPELQRPTSREGERHVSL